MGGQNGTLYWFPEGGNKEDLRESDAPMVLLDYCIERRALIANATAKDNYKLQGAMAHAATFGEPPNISNLRWGWYKWCYYRDDTTFPQPREVRGRCLGPAKNKGSEMAQYVLNIKGSVVPRHTLRWLWPDELSVSNVTEGQKRYIFYRAIHDKLGDSYSFAPPRPDNDLVARFEDVLSKDEISPDLPYIVTGEEAASDIPEGDVVNAAGKQIREGVNLIEALIGAEVMLPREDGKAQGICKVL